MMKNNGELLNNLGNFVNRCVFHIKPNIKLACHRNIKFPGENSESKCKKLNSLKHGVRSQIIHLKLQKSILAFR